MLKIILFSASILLLQNNINNTIEQNELYAKNVSQNKRPNLSVSKTVGFEISKFRVNLVA